MRTRTVFRAIAAIACVLAAGTAAQAEIVQYHYNTVSREYGMTATLVPLTSGDGTSISFVSKKAGVTTVTFSAECSVYGSNANHWLSIDILIDGVALQPTAGPDDAFCTEVISQYVYATQSITVAKSLTKGPHTLTVQARVTGDTGWLDDVAVLVAR